MSTASKAVVRETVQYANGRGPALAALGEYSISRGADGAIVFHGANDFTLSLDAVCQHLFEGRIALVGGRTLPA